MNPLAERAVGCLCAAAVGDALGGATERWLPDEIRERWGGWVTGIVGPWHEDWRTRRPVAPFHKGDGHVTDDTLMTRCLVDVYLDKQEHLDAFDMADRVVPRLNDEVVWIPELETDTVLLQRLALAEKYLSLRLAWAHVDPREAGVGNAVNCGAAMYMAPVGIVNAGDPDGAYAEAIALTGAHQSSFGREAAGVMAAAVAAALAPGAEVDHVVAAALRLARDGTHDAIAAACDAAVEFDDWREAVDCGALRDAVRPYDLVADTYRDRGLAAHRPSRLHSIEELPIAIALLKIAAGDVRETILGGVNYGRDADSIASMGGALAGALGGRATVPDAWVRDVAAASRLDLEQPGRDLAALTVRIRERDRRRREQADTRFAQLVRG